MLLLAEGYGDSALERLVATVVYPLWDAGLTVGHAVRSPREAVTRALAEVTVATATLDGRLVVGDAELWRGVRTALARGLRERPEAFLAALEDADTSRRARYGDTAEVLEPHLKEGAGGLRDIQSLRWAATVLLGEAGLDPLVAAGYVTAPDRTSIARHHDLLLAVRVALHLEAGRGEDVLSLERQAAVARRLGYDGDQPADRLLRDVFLAARTVDHVHRSAWSLVRADVRRRRRRLRRPPERTLPGGFAVADGVLRLTEDADLADSSFPTALLDALVATGATLDRTAAGRVVRAVESAPTWSWDDTARARFLDVLWDGERALPALTEVDHLGVLDTLVPQWRALRARPQRNPYHRYSLDRHALHTAAALAEITRREPWAGRRLEQVGDRDGLMLGALLHDVGKAHGEPHTETGPPVAREVATLLGAPPATCDLVARLVALHLLLPEVATRRDLADDGLVAGVAASVGDRGTLACLHLLAAADGIATGPSAWGSWKAALVADLAAKVDAVLAGAAPDAGGEADEARRLAGETGIDEATVRAHLALLPDRYATSVPAAAVARHARAAAVPLAPAEVRLEVTPTAHSGVEAVDVVAAGHPHLFARTAGVLTLHGASVLSAHAFTRADGVGAMTLWVRRPEGSGGGWWAEFESDLRAAVAGRLALRARVARKAAVPRRPRRRPPRDVPARVEIHPDNSGELSVVEVRTRDHLGVLHAITSALAELGLEVIAAKADTVGDEVVDVFYVKDCFGAPLDEEHAAEVALAVRAALDGA